jgi:twinkle protein
LNNSTKIGKTTLKNALGAHFVSKDDVKVFMACPEEPNQMTYKLMANQLTGKIFHDPKVEFDNKAYEEAGEVLKDKLYMLNLYQHLGWNTLKDDIVAAVGEGCKAVFIDPITNLSNGVNAADANTLLQEFAQELSAMALDMQFTAFLFAHLKASDGQLSADKRHSYYSKGQYLDLGSCSHEMGGSVYSSQFAGSRAMQRSCNLMLGMLGNKDPELPDNIRNMREIRVLEDRAFGTSGVYSLFYNKNTGKFQEL